MRSLHRQRFCSRGPTTLRAVGLVASTALLLLAGPLVAGCSSDGDQPADGSTTSVSDDDSAAASDPSAARWTVAGTGQTACYDDATEIACPTPGEAFYGQNGNVPGRAPSYTDNGDGTVTDDVTGLMWQQDPGDKTSYSDAVAGADSFDLAGRDDWRLPTIKELYSLILFTGVDPSSYLGDDTSMLVPYLDTNMFGFDYGDTNEGQRIIDSQWTTSTVDVSTVFDGQECFFGVNFADGRIKCYPTKAGGNGGYFTRYVRGGSGYGTNALRDGGDGTVIDDATGLMWQQADSGTGLDWRAALSYCQSLELAGHDDWRLPDAKELQGIVDYSRSPDTTDSAAIDAVFETTSITDEAGEVDYPAFWTSTTHLSYPDNASEAAYVTFGKALGYVDGAWIDVHGAGAQRSDPKVGDASQFETGRGPQGDAIRIENGVRCVRG